ncbi:MAG: glycosyltransferase family 4 protein [Xanthobacteraceae bacterium]
MPTAFARGGTVATSKTAFEPHSLKILHIMRAPLGGLFRHVLDVTRGQAECGHRVGLIVDGLTGSVRADQMLAQLAPHLAFGVERIAIARHLSVGDFAALHSIARRIAALAPDVVHGHGAKAGALVRLAPRRNAVRVYTPHGGSLVYAPGSTAARFYLALERLLNRRTDLFLFESDYIAQQFRARIGTPPGLVHIVHNGVGEAEFAPITPAADGADLVCIGELRDLKGIDVLLGAMAMLKDAGRPLTAVIAGEGPQRDELAALTQNLGLGAQVRFVGYRAAREAFAMGRILVVPSRAESLPYIVLEAAAAAMPIIATRVGGIAEIFGTEASQLLPAGDVDALAHAIGAALDDPAHLRRLTQAINARVRREFTIKHMVENGLASYRQAVAVRKAAQFT